MVQTQSQNIVTIIKRIYCRCLKINNRHQEADSKRQNNIKLKILKCFFLLFCFESINVERDVKRQQARCTVATTLTRCYRHYTVFTVTESV